MKINDINLKKSTAMKTLKQPIIISLVLIIAGINLLFAIPANTRILIGPIFRGISYNVSIHYQSEFPLCNSYLVQIVDAQGYSVAPDQVFQPGVNTYVFHERGPVWGVRIARLVKSPAEGNITCTYDLVTPPDIKSGRFLVGVTYFFNLFPATPQVSKSIKE
jgi:hypothetical protein